MQNTFRVEKPDSITFALITTMSLEDWKRLDKQLSQIPAENVNCYPLSGLRDVIYELTRQAEKVFKPSADIENTAT